MTHRVTILPRAKRQILDQALWWSEHRSPEQAFRWIDGFEKALASLADRPERFSAARESEGLGIVLHELHFGLRGKSTHRAVFEIRDDEVVVHTVRHLAQRDLKPSDIT